jgi:hypothetical protein
MFFFVLDLLFLVYLVVKLFISSTEGSVAVSMPVGLIDGVQLVMMAVDVISFAPLDGSRPVNMTKASLDIWTDGRPPTIIYAFDQRVGA